MGRIIGCFFPLNVCIVPSGKIKASAQEESFMPIPSHGSLGLSLKFVVSQPLGVTFYFWGANSILLQMSIVIVCNILAVSYTTLTNKPKEIFVPRLVLGFLVSGLWLLEES